MNDEVFDLIRRSSDTHYETAKIAARILRDRFAWIKGSWHVKCGDHWEELETPAPVRIALSEDVCSSVIKAVVRMNAMAISSQRPDEQTRLMAHAKKLEDLAEKLKMTPFKQHVLAEMSDIMMR